MRDFTFRNKDNDFSVVLLSNDKKTERVTTEHSVRSNFKSFLPVDLDLTNGLWEMAVDRVILPNRQNNALKLKISPLLGTKEIKEIDFTPGVYDDTYQVLDELINLGENTELDLEFNKENYGKDEFLFGEFSRSSKIRNLHLTFPISFGIEKFKKNHNREVTTLFDVWIVMELCTTHYGTHLHDSSYSYPRYEYSGNIETNPEIIFKTGSTTTTQSVKQMDTMFCMPDYNNRHLWMNFFVGDYSNGNNNFPYFWVSENLANALKLDEYSSFYQSNQDIIRLNNPNGKTVFLLIHKSKPATTSILGYGYDVRMLDGKGVEKINNKRKLLEIKLKGDEIIMKSNFKIEFVNRNGKVTYTNPVETKLKKTNVRQNLVGDVSKLVEKDVSAVNLYLPSIYSTKPIFLKSSIEQNLFDVNIHLKKGTETILHQTRRERQYYPVRQSREKFIEVLLKETQTGLVPKFWYGFTLIVLHFRKAKRNWFEQF